MNVQSIEQATGSTGLYARSICQLERLIEQVEKQTGRRVHCVHFVAHSGRDSLRGDVNRAVLSYAFLEDRGMLGMGNTCYYELAHYSCTFDRLNFWDRWFGRSYVNDAYRVGEAVLPDRENPIPVLRLDA